jgi:hypothetical protein
MIVRKGWNRSRRVEHDIEFAKEEQTPLLLDPCTREVGFEPIPMAHHGGAGALGFKAVITGRQRRGRALLLLITIRRASCPFSASAAKAAFRIAGSRDRSSHPTLRWRSFDSGSLICVASKGYTVSADGLSLRLRRRRLR